MDTNANGEGVACADDAPASVLPAMGTAASSILVPGAKFATGTPEYMQAGQEILTSLANGDLIQADIQMGLFAKATGATKDVVRAQFGSMAGPVAPDTLQNILGLYEVEPHPNP